MLEEIVDILMSDNEPEVSYLKTLNMVDGELEFILPLAVDLAYRRLEFSLRLGASIREMLEKQKTVNRNADILLSFCLMENIKASAIMKGLPIGNILKKLEYSERSKMNYQRLVRSVVVVLTFCIGVYAFVYHFNSKITSGFFIIILIFLGYVFKTSSKRIDICNMMLNVINIAKNELNK